MWQKMTGTQACVRLYRRRKTDRLLLVERREVSRFARPEMEAVTKCGCFASDRWLVQSDVLSPENTQQISKLCYRKKENVKHLISNVLR